MRSPCDGIGSDRFGNAGNLALEHRRGCLRRDVPRSDARPAGREHERYRIGQLLDRRGDLAPLVRDDPSQDFVAVVGEQVLEQAPALVRPLAAGNAVRDGEDRRLQTSSFVFSSKRTSLTTIESSTAFAMS
jgi:hypothetical protein